MYTWSAVRTLFTLVALVISITVHECMHAWTADRLGDDTARRLGRVTLNPITHLDPLGSLMMLVTTVTGVGIGWGKPVPVATHRLRFGAHMGHGLVSLAGPGANLALALLVAGIWRLSVVFVTWPTIAEQFVLQLILVSLVIAFFNLMPIPPLDGFAVLLAAVSSIGQVWSRRLLIWMEGLYRYGWMILFGIVLLSQLASLPLIQWLIGRPAWVLYALLTGQ